MPPCSARSSTSRCRGGLRPCLTGPARGGLPAGRSGRRDGQPSVEHRDGSCGGLLLVVVLGPIVEWAAVSEPFQSPQCIVALHEGTHRSSDFGSSAEGSAPDGLLLEGPEEPLDDAVALRLVREGIAQRYAPVTNLTGEVVGRVLRPVVQTQRDAAGVVGAACAEPGSDRLADRLQG